MAITSERVAEIERRLADLGDVTCWSSAIDNETGDLLLVLPGQFRYPPLPGQPTGALILENMETSTADDHALMEFLGDAPHAIRDLLASNRAAYDLLQELYELTGNRNMRLADFMNLLERIGSLINPKEASHAT